MFDQTDYIMDFEENATQDAEIGATHGRDKWLRGAITLFAVLVAGYTTVHGISATVHYRASGTAGIVTGITGIVVLEGLFLVLSHGLINGTFKGDKKHVALMVLSAAVALVFMLLNTVIDAQLNADMALSPNMAAYFRYVLPVSSVIATVLALAGLYFAPDAERARQRGEAVNAHKQQQFITYMAARNAELMVQRIIANAQLAGRVSAAKTVAAHYQSEEVRGLIEGAAVSSIPALLRAIGVSDNAQATGIPTEPRTPASLPATAATYSTRAASPAPTQPARNGRHDLTAPAAVEPLASFQRPAVVNGRAATPAAATATAETYDLDQLLAAAGTTREQARELLNKHGIATSRRAYVALGNLGRLPAGVTFEQFEPLFDELMSEDDTRPTHRP